MENSCFEISELITNNIQKVYEENYVSKYILSNMYWKRFMYTFKERRGKNLHCINILRLLLLHKDIIAVAVMRRINNMKEQPSQN